MPDMRSRVSETDTESTDEMHPTVLVKRYKIIRQLGSGSTARVYLAEHRELQRRVALKVHAMSEERERCWKGEARFALEARTLAKLDHPNVVRIYDFGRTDKDHVFLAMEYVNGPRLADIIRQGKVLAPRRAVSLMRQVCMALQAAHDQAVIHRDLKAANVMIDRDEEGSELVKVVDFGLVKPCPPRENPDEELSDDGQILGSPHTMAPEQLQGMDMDHRVDIYATGVLLFRLLTGVYPFDGPNHQSTMLSHLHDDAPTFASLKLPRPIPRGIEPIVRRCLSRNPADRYGSAIEVAGELQEWLDAGDPPAAGKRVGLVAGLGVAALLLVVALGVGSWLLLRGSGDADVAPVAEEFAPAPTPPEMAPAEPAEVVPPGPEGTAEAATEPAPEPVEEPQRVSSPRSTPAPAATPTARSAVKPTAKPAARPAAPASAPPAEPEAPPQAETEPAEGTEEPPATQETDLPPGYLPIGY